MAGHEFVEIHLVKLVAAEDEEPLPGLLEKVGEVLAHGVGRALIPTGPGGGLLRGENFHEAAGAENIEFVGRVDVPVQRGGVELGQHIDVADAGVEAVADGDIDQPVFAAERDGGFGAVLGQGEEPFARAAAHDDSEGARQGIGRPDRMLVWHNVQRSRANRGQCHAGNGGPHPG